jgi:hypothetical protein
MSYNGFVYLARVATTIQNKTVYQIGYVDNYRGFGRLNAIQESETVILKNVNGDAKEFFYKITQVLANKPEVVFTENDEKFIIIKDEKKIVKQIETAILGYGKKEDKKSFIIPNWNVISCFIIFILLSYVIAREMI